MIRRMPPLRPTAATLRHAWRAFAVGTAGVAAIEFALILPVMITMYLGVTEFSFGYATNRKLTLLSRTVADLTARATTISGDDISGIFAAASSVLQPYDSAQASMVLTSVTVKMVNSKPVGTVDWSCAKLGPGSPYAKRGKGSTYPVPSGFENSSSFVLSETAYKYVPVLGSSFAPAGGYTLQQSTPWPVRNSAQVTWSGSAC